MLRDKDMLRIATFTLLANVFFSAVCLTWFIISNGAEAQLLIPGLTNFFMVWYLYRSIK